MREIQLLPFRKKEKTHSTTPKKLSNILNHQTSKQKMVNNIFSETLGDHFAYSINIDFIRKKTSIIYGGSPSVDNTPKYELVFTDIVWQDFDGFNFDNILTAIEIDNSFLNFLKYKQEFILKWKPYLPESFFETIETDKSLSYYYFYPVTGLGGFVICKDACIINLGQE